jgi:DNA-binding XRE family transcriptional regulator
MPRHGAQAEVSDSVHESRRFCSERNSFEPPALSFYRERMAEIIPLPTKAPRSPRDPEPLWRDALGDRLRRLRHERGERLADTADRAGVSPQYLSEIERGLKEPSSEMIAAVAGALEVTLIELTAGVVDDLRSRVAERAAVGSRTTYALAA